MSARERLARDSRVVAVTEGTCTEMVSEPPGYWHEHRCPRRAQWQLTFAYCHAFCTQHAATYLARRDLHGAP